MWVLAVGCVARFSDTVPMWIDQRHIHRMHDAWPPEAGPRFDPDEITDDRD